MIAEVVAQVVKRLGGPAMPTYDTVVPGTPSYPYALVWSTTGRMATPTLDAALWLDDRLGVTAVDLTADGVRRAQARNRLLLEGWTPVISTGRAHELRLWDAQAIQADRDAPAATRDVFPLFGVDLYQVSATPLRRTP